MRSAGPYGAVAASGVSASQLIKVVVGGVAAAVIVNVLAQVRLPAVNALYVGIGFVVLLGSGGLVCRGVGEIRGSFKWKAAGYFMGAAAYVATATVALLNVVPRLLGLPS